MGLRLLNSKPLDDGHFQTLCKVLEKNTGIRVASNRKDLFSSRLQRRMHTYGCNDWDEYISLLKADKEVFQDFVNCMTTNKTEFFRESAHFRFFEERVIPDAAHDRRTLMVWSGASSYGHEIYSLMMTIEQYNQIHASKAVPYKILGTDIDTNALSIAERGAYDPVRVAEQVPPAMRTAYFSRTQSGGKDELMVKPHLKKNLKFRYFNLSEPGGEIPLRFDAIFLRNVLIYFPRPTIKSVVLPIMVQHLRPGGYFFIGHSETLRDILPRELEEVKPAVFRRKA